MKKLFSILGLLILLQISTAYAQNSTAVVPSNPPPAPASSAASLAAPTIANEFYRAEILEIIEEGQDTTAGTPQPYQMVRLELLNGPEKGQKTEVRHGDFFAIQESQKVKKGETVIVARTPPEEEGQQASYYITEKYRLPGLLWIAIIFLATAIFFGRKKGITSLLGLAASIFILIKIIVPAIVSGANPLATAFWGSLLIAVISLYLAHGFNKRTSIALLSTVITIGISTILALIYAPLAKLSGAATEDIYFLQSGPLAHIDFQGLLLAGMIIGTLGVLDDITTAQTASIEEIKKADPTLNFHELYKRGISIGREHISSLINTLVLAYAGASFTLFLIFAVDQGGSIWATLNNEVLAEEIVRTLVGSTALIFAVPISTFFAAYFFSRRY